MRCGMAGKPDTWAPSGTSLVIPARPPTRTSLPTETWPPTPAWPQIIVRAPIRVLRDNVVIFEGELESLRRFKDDVNEVKSGVECGIGVKNYNDIKSGDQIECYERVLVKREL